MAQEENLYSLPDAVIDKIEKAVDDAAIDAETAEDYLDACFPELSAETKVKIAIFSDRYTAYFLTEEEEQD